MPGRRAVAGVEIPTDQGEALTARNLPFRPRELTVYSEGRTAGIVKLGLAVVIAATLVFCLVDLLGGPFYSLSTKTWPPQLRDDKLIGGIEGTVKEADSATSTVRVASGFLGLASLPLVVTPETIIAVQGKFGGFADLERRQFLRVAYEILPDRLLATRVDVLDQWSQPSVVSAETDDSATVNQAESARAREPVAALAESPPRAPARSGTPSSPRAASPIAVQRSRTTAPATEHPRPSPIAPAPTATQDTRRLAPVTAAVAADAAPAPPAPGPSDGHQVGDDTFTD